MSMSERLAHILRTAGTSDDGAGGGGAPSGNEAPPAGNPAAPGSAGGDPNQVIVTKAEYAEFLKAKEQASTLTETLKSSKQVETDTLTLLNPQAPRADQEAALRRTLARAGQDQSSIDAYVAEQFGDPSKSEGNQKPKSKTSPDDDRVQELEGRLTTMQRDMHAEKAKSLNTELDTQVRSSIDTVPEVVTLIEDLTPPDSEGNQAATAKVQRAKASLAGEIRRETLDILRERRARETRANGGREVWSDTWIAEAAREAAKSVATRHADLRPDTSKIGRSPEAGIWAGIDTKKPVQKPSYEKGMDMSKAQEVVRKFAVDTLLQAAATSGDGTRV